MSKRPPRFDEVGIESKKPKKNYDESEICHLCSTIHDFQEPLYKQLGDCYFCPDCFKTEEKIAKVNARLEAEKKKWKKNLTKGESMLATMFYSMQFENEIPKKKEKKQAASDEEDDEEKEEDEEEEEDDDVGYEPDHEDDPFVDIFYEWLHENGSDYNPDGIVRASDMKEALTNVMKSYVYAQCEK